MTIKKSYNSWAETYDNSENKTRDLDQKMTERILSSLEFDHVLELGCGSGKNTEWLVTKAKHVTAIDFSGKMLEKAQEKIKSDKVTFVNADLNSSWDAPENSFDLVTSSLVLEHIENIDFIFSQANKTLIPGGKFFISELHPFKQYNGSKAKFETSEGLHELEVYTHHISEFCYCAFRNAFNLVELSESFDEDSTEVFPRLIHFIFEHKPV